MINLSLNKKVIIFGFIFTFFSSFGQSFFLGLFNAPIRNELNITHGQFGTIYASATICSSLLLIWLGKKIDDYRILNYSFFVVALLFFSSLFFSFINSVYFLAVGIFLMRLSGQGLMSHASTTTISRFFEKSRGRALSTVWFGLSTAEFILPVFIVFLLTVTSWQNIWISISLVLIIFLPIISFVLIKNVTLETRENSLVTKNIRKKIKQWKRVEVLKDYRFYIISLNMLAMPSIATGVFVYQSFILSSKNWGPFVIAQSFMVYSVMSVITLTVAGFLIDKFSSRRLLIFMNIPLFLSAVILAKFNSELSSFVFFAFVGITNGLANVLGSSTWAEIYGVKFIGSVKALSTSLMVFATASGTAIFGILIDYGLSINQIAVYSAFYIASCFLMLFFVRNKLEPTYL